MGERGTAGEFVSHDDVPGCREQQRQRHVGGRRVKAAGSVPHGNAANGARRDVDVVDSHAMIAHHAHVGHAVEERTVDRRVAVGNDRLNLAQYRRPR